MRKRARRAANGLFPANEFPAALAGLCQRLGIEIEDNEKGIFLLRVQLSGKRQALRAPREHRGKEA